MSKGISYAVGIIIAIIVIAAIGFALMQKGQQPATTPISTPSKAVPTLGTQDAEASSQVAESSASSFVDESTPTIDQTVPGLS